ncbi:MAG: MFS transporter [Gammaproteobacteria bacterium]|nr:MFS transporter [Gammaproteobacteria bacterium]
MSPAKHHLIHKPSNPKALRSETTLMPWLIWFIAVLFYAYEFTQRVSLNVYLPTLSLDLNSSVAQLGVMGSAFYIAYAVMQIPGGFFIDILGPKKLSIVGVILLTIGTFCFGFIHQLDFGILARILMGLGSAFAFICAMQFIIIWFPPGRFALLAGLTNLAGYIGASIGEVPLTQAVHHFGWRTTSYGSAGIGIIIIILMAIIIRDKPFVYRKNVKRHKQQAKKKNIPQIFKGLKTVLSNGINWLNGIYAAFMMGATSAFAAFWGVTFFTQMDGLSRTLAAGASTAIFIGVAAGSPIFGWWSDVIKKRQPLLILAALGSALMTIALIFANHITIWTIYTLCFFFGVFQSAHVLNFANAKDINPRKNSGSAMGFTNMAALLGGSSLIPTIGFLLEWAQHGSTQHGTLLFSRHSFHEVFIIIPICQLVSMLIAIVFLKDSTIRAHHKPHHHASKR